jgi:hypothetical protein
LYQKKIGNARLIKPFPLVYTSKPNSIKKRLPQRNKKQQAPPAVSVRIVL